MGQFGGPGFAQWCKEAIPRLVQVIQAPDSREQENVNPTENAISAVTKILKWNQGAINVDEILPVWYVIIKSDMKIKENKIFPMKIFEVSFNSSLLNIFLGLVGYQLSKT